MGFVVGLTGGIGSGKTAVTDRFAQFGITIADADLASRKVVEPGTPALAAIHGHFGDSILNPDGTLNRPSLRTVVFADTTERTWLEGVTVPAIMNLLRKILSESQSAYAILMLSSGGGRSPLVQRNLVVDVSSTVQIERVTRRDNNTPEQVRAIMAAQPSRQSRLQYADDVIVNDGDISDLDAEVLRLHRLYLELAANHG
jgi:dephospho-CoA kinase